jgi:RNA polymerase sigma-70 factor, ECF subfamily
MSKYRHTTTDEDSALVVSWRSGELASFEALVAKYQKRMFTIAVRITGDYEDACEVVQAAFVAAYRGIDSLRGAARFSTWLTGITVSQCRNRLEQAPAASPTRPRLVQATLHEKLQDCIKALPVELREALVLRDVQEFSCAEICDILAVPEGTVKSRLFQAREMVRGCLKQAVGEPR